MAPKCLRMFQHKPVVVRADLLCRMRKHSPATVDGVSGGYLLETRHPKFGWVRLSHYIEIPAIIICDFSPLIHLLFRQRSAAQLGGLGGQTKRIE